MLLCLPITISGTAESSSFSLQTVKTNWRRNACHQSEFRSDFLCWNNPKLNVCRQDAWQMPRLQLSPRPQVSQGEFRACMSGFSVVTLQTCWVSGSLLIWRYHYASLIIFWQTASYARIVYMYIICLDCWILTIATDWNFCRFDCSSL